MIIDYHIHTNYSDDCEYPMEEVVKDFHFERMIQAEQNLIQGK